MISRTGGGAPISAPEGVDAPMRRVTGGGAAGAPGGAVRSAELTIGGMTCASCAARVEKKLNKLDGVTATATSAAEKAFVRLHDGVTPDALITAVEQAGYTAALPAAPTARPPAAGEDAGEDEAAALRQRLPVSLALAIPVVVLAMIPQLQFRNWQWASLALATPVAVWGAWPFHRAAAINARHGAATMDTLISVGGAAAYLWSLYALFVGTGATYLEVASGVTALVLLGRYLEARAKRRSGAALRALL